MHIVADHNKENLSLLLSLNRKDDYVCRDIEYERCKGAMLDSSDPFFIHSLLLLLIQLVAPH